MSSDFITKFTFHNQSSSLIRIYQERKEYNSQFQDTKSLQETNTEITKIMLAASPLGHCHHMVTGVISFPRSTFNSVNRFN